MAMLIMAIGLPASGKSTFYKNEIEPQPYESVYVSSDAIREEVFGDVNDQNHNNEVFNIMFKRAVEGLKADKLVYYDATNISRKRRMNFIKEVRAAVKDKDIFVSGVIFAPDIQTVMARNMERERTVPAEVIKRMLYHFEVPAYAEGFNKISIYEVGNGSLFGILDELRKVAHDNPHHSLSIGEHMDAAYEGYIHNAHRQSFVVARALQFHDIGKGIVKQFKDARGRIVPVAHYYCHENVGAYMYLSMSVRMESDLYVALLINHHMDHFKGEKYLERMRKIYGDIFMSDLEIVHKYDVAAH
jgi:predicted kinase